MLGCMLDCSLCKKGISDFRLHPESLPGQVEAVLCSVKKDGQDLPETKSGHAPVKEIQEGGQVNEKR